MSDLNYWQCKRGYSGNPKCRGRHKRETFTSTIPCASSYEAGYKCDLTPCPYMNHTP